MCMVEIRNRKTLQSKVNICKSDVKIGDYADSLSQLQLRYMKICVINCCSIRNKLTYVIDHVNEHNSDIVAITESWLSSEDSNNRIVSQECGHYDYNLFHVPRSNRRGGGVALLIKNGLNVITQAHSIRQSFEHVELLVTAISIHLRIVVI